MKKSFKQRSVNKSPIDSSDLVYEFEDSALFKQSVKDFQMSANQIQFKFGHVYKKILCKEKPIYPIIQNETLLFIIKNFDKNNIDKFRESMLAFFKDNNIDYQCFLGFVSIICISFIDDENMDSCLEQLAPKFEELCTKFGYEGRLNVVQPSSFLTL
jgi:hypothetical protein